jgi:transposase-like protein
MGASLRFASKNDYPLLVPALRAICTAPTEEAAAAGLAELETSPLVSATRPSPGPGARRGHSSCRCWPSRGAASVVYSTNLIESINARLRKVTRNRRHFPTERAAVKVLYLAIRHMIEPKAGDRNQVAPGWKSALSALTLYFEARITIC